MATLAAVRSRHSPRAAGAFALTRLLAPPYDTAATGTATFAAAAALLLAATVAGGWLPARRAASNDPMAALRVA